jgi:hypothetical protein
LLIQRRPRLLQLSDDFLAEPFDKLASLFDGASQQRAMFASEPY